MKKVIVLTSVAIAVILGTLSLTSCNDKDDNENESYYVRYSVGIISEGDLLMNFTNPDPGGNTIVQQRAMPGTVEVTVGPAKRGFEAEMTANIDGHAVDWIRIDVARDDRPFVMKRYLRHGLSLSHYVGDDINQ